MSVKIYKKRGKMNYREKRMVKELQPIIDRMKEQNPDMDWEPATSEEELKNLHEQYASAEAEYETNESVDQNENEENFSASKEEVEDDYEEDDADDRFIDPMNREEPLVRDYVMEAGENRSGADMNTSRNFSEPTTFDEAFEIPDPEELEEKAQSERKNQSKSSNQGAAEKKAKSKPINPDFDTMSTSQKKKKTKRFAHYIVEAVCMLAEKGFVWYANKEISPGKLAEYEVTGEINLQLLLTVSEDQSMTVKEFFLSQNAAAEELAKYSDEEKADLTEALTEVMLEKGIAPTPMQELALIAASVFGQKALMLMALKQQTNAVLNQLREMPTQPVAAPEPFEPPVMPINQTEQKEVESETEIEEPTYQEQVEYESEVQSLESESVESNPLAIVETKE